MLKLVGLLLILGGGGACCVMDIRRRRSRIRLVDGWVAALDRMESEIRWKNSPLTEILRGFKGGDRVSLTMDDILHRTSEDCPLQNAWQSAVAALQPPELGEILAAIPLDGDSEHMLGNLRYGQSRLQTLSSALKAQEAGEERLHLALTLSGAGLLAILLW